MKTFSLLFVFALACQAQEVFYFGDVNGTVATDIHPLIGGAAGSTTYIGVSLRSGGPYDPNYVIQMTTGFLYDFVNEGNRKVFFTTSAGIGGSTANSLTTGITGGSLAGEGDHVGQPGDTLTVNATALGVGSYRYQVYTTGIENAGFLAIVSACVDLPPATPVLLAPANVGTVNVGGALRWEPASFGVECGVPDTRYRVVIRPGTGGPPLASDPLLGDSSTIFRRLPATQSAYTLTTSDVSPGNVYTWKVVAVNAVFTRSSAERTFSVPDQSSTVKTLRNGVTVQGRMYPTIPASVAGYLYYRFEVVDGGGTVQFRATAASIPTASPPLAGDVQLFVAHGNASTTARPSEAAGQHDYRSAAVSSSAVAVRVDGAPAGVYVVAVRSSTGSSTFALTAEYFCPATAFLAAAGETECTACPANAEQASATASSQSDCVCRRGFYGSPETSCSACPTGGICDGGPRPAASIGFWSAVSDGGQVFYKCPLRKACLGGDDSACQEGYDGRLCANCAENYYKLGGQCYECPASPSSNFVAGVVLLVLFLVASFELARFYRRVSSVSVVINFVQTLAVTNYFQLGWPQWLQVAFNDCSGFNLNTELTAPECVADMYWQTKWGFTLLFPVIVFLAMVAVFCVFTLVGACLRHLGYSAPDRHSLVDHLVPSFITFLLFVYLSVTRAALSFFDCTEQPDGSYTLDVSADILCYSSTWNKLLPAAVIALFGYGLCIPLGFLVFLVYRSGKLYDLSATGDDMYMWMGPLYLRYKPHLFFWEFVHFVRKALLLVIASFLSTFPFLQTVLAIALFSAALMLQVTFDPYEFSLTNFLETVLLFVQILLFLAGLVYQSNEVAEDGLGTALFVLVVVAFAVCFFVASAVIIRELYHKHKALPRSVYESLLRQLHEIQREKLDKEDHMAAASHTNLAPTLPAANSSTT